MTDSSLVQDSSGGGEEQIYALLFSECDSNNTGWVTVDALVNYIAKMLTGDTHVRDDEEVYDSDESIHEAQYNLDLLKCMLNTHAVNGDINEVSYQYVIGKWVNDIRSRSGSPSSSKSRSATPESVSSSDHDDKEDHDGTKSSQNSLLQESFETTGGGGSYHDIDPGQLMSSLAESQLESKRLRDRNDQLLLQMESSEENMRQLQVDNKELNNKIKSQQQSLVYLDSIKQDNTELTEQLIEGEELCLQLKEKIDSLQQDLQELQLMISDLQNQLTCSNNERDELLAQTKTFQQLLTQKEEELSQLEEERETLQTCLEDQNQETQSLHSRLTTTTEAVEELKFENSSLQKQLIEDNGLPISSTPFRPQAPSLHDELAQSVLVNGMSPLNVNPSMDELIESMMEEKGEELGFFEKLANSKAKFEEKAKLMNEGLSELIDTPLTILGNGDKSRTEQYVSTSEENKDVIEAKLRKVETVKRRDRQRAQKLSDELDEMRKENEKLKKMCEELQNRVKEKGLIDSSGNYEQITSEQSTQTVYTSVHEDDVTSSLDKEEVILSVVATQTDLPVNNESPGKSLEDKITSSPNTTPISDSANESPEKSLEDQSTSSPNTTPISDGATSDSGYQILTESATPTLSEYHTLQEEITRLRQELVSRDMKNEPPTQVNEFVHVDPNALQHEMCVPLEGSTPIITSESLSSVSTQTHYRVRKVPKLEVKSVLEESIITSAPKSGCISLFAHLLYTILKVSTWILLFLLLVFMLVLILVGVNSTLSRCGGRLCSHSPLHMLLGQHLDYEHAGSVAM